MKNRKVLVVSFILVACLTIGVGFAALTGSLRADGIVHINLDDSNLKVQYTDANETVTFKTPTTSDQTLVEGTDYTIEYTSEKTVATVTLKNHVMKAIGDTVTVKLPIANYSEGVGAKVMKPSVTMQGNAAIYLTQNGVAASLNGDSTAESVELKCQAHNEGELDTCFLLITITLNQVPTESNVTCNFSVALNCSSVPHVE